MKESKIKIFANHTKVPVYKTTGASGFDISVKFNPQEVRLSTSQIYKLTHNQFEDNISWLYGIYIYAYKIQERQLISFDNFVKSLYKALEDLPTYFDIPYHPEGSLYKYMDDNNINDVNVVVPYSNSTFPTGLHFEIPDEDEIQVRTRSGIAAKTLMCVKLGTLDSDWRGDTAVIVQNPTPFAYIIVPGMRLAQGVVIEKKHANFEIVNSVEDLSKTERGDKGLGSTGTK